MSSHADTFRGFIQFVQRRFHDAPIWVRGDQTDPPDTGEYVVIDLAEEPVGQISRGSGLPSLDRHRYVGIVSVTVHIPEGARQTRAYELADRLDAILKAQRFAFRASGAIRTLTPGVDRIGVVDGTFQLQVRTGYERDAP